MQLVQDRDREILDVGCGDGPIAQRLEALGRSVVGIEIDPSKAALAKPFCQSVIVGNIEQAETLGSLRSLGRTYDPILCSEVVEHLSFPQETLRKLLEVLRPGGALLAVLPNVAFYKTRLALLRGRWDYTSEGILDRTHRWFFTRKSAHSLFANAGLRISDSRVTHYSRRFAFLYDRLIRWWPGLFAEQFVIRAARPEHV